MFNNFYFDAVINKFVLFSVTVEWPIILITPDFGGGFEF